MDCYNGNCPVRANTTSSMYFCANVLCESRQPHPVTHTVTNRSTLTMSENEKARLPGDLQRQQSGNAVNVVRCKDCAMWKRYLGRTYGYCSGWGTDTVMVSENFFCGLGSKNKVMEVL